MEIPTDPPRHWLYSTLAKFRSTRIATTMSLNTFTTDRHRAMIQSTGITKAPLSKGAVLADEAGLGKTIEAGLDARSSAQCQAPFAFRGPESPILLDLYPRSLVILWVMHTAQWKLADILRRHRKSALALAKASSLTKTTVYNILHNKSKAVELDTLGKLLAGLEALTGERMSFDDLLERQAPSASIDALFQGAKPLHWANLDPLSSPTGAKPNASATLRPNKPSKSPKPPPGSARLNVPVSFKKLSNPSILIDTADAWIAAQRWS
jgi:hypothetical protein